MPDLNDKPTDEIIDSAAEYLQEVWNKAHSKWRDIDLFYQLKYHVWTTKEHQKRRSSFHPSTAANRVDHAVDTLLAFKPTVRREPVGDAKDAEDKANRVEEALSAILEDAAAREMIIPAKQTGGNFVQYGYTHIEGPMLDSKTLNTPRNGHANWNPIRTRVLPPDAVLLDPAEKEPTVAVKLTTRVVKDLLELSIRKQKQRIDAKVFDVGSKKPYDEVETIEYWVDKWHAVKIKDGGTLFIEKNTWPFEVPYAHAFSGWGRMPTNVEGFDPQYLAVGILDKTRDSIRAQAQRLSAHHNLLMQNAYPFIITSEDPVEIAAQMRAGGILSGEPLATTFMKSPEVSAAMFEIGREVDEDIELGTSTRALAGFRQTGVSTVGQNQQLTTQAQRKFLAPAVQNEDLWSIIGSRILRMVDTMSSLKDGITAKGKTLRRSDIDGNYDIKVTYEVIDPQLDLQRREMGMREHGEGLKSGRTYRAVDARMPNESEEVRRIRRERVETNPGVMAVIDQDTADEMGLGDEFRRGQELLQEQAGDSRVNPNPEEAVNTGLPQNAGAGDRRNANPERSNFNGT